MVQGCTSDAGKSFMVAGLCRMLARQNIRVAPFKPQNMSLNSSVTKDGGEIGRAQAVQAVAAGVDPHTDMNPILLKPSSDTGAQIIVQGRAVSSMQAKEFHDYKKVAMTAVLDSHHHLANQFQKIIVEGAGSPAEINLRDGDIANMGFAEAVDCPVILIADIDRGGVFAHLVGTLDLLAPSERARVVGFVINKFRGELSMLESGLEWLERRTQKPVLGVLPFLPAFYLDAEDAITVAQQCSPDDQLLKVVVPVLPRISNHTDFDALRLHPKIDLQFVSAHQACPPADLIILPGSKSVIADLQLLRAAGWDASIKKHLRYGGKLLGICGGLQMLGQTVSDPNAVEGSLKSAPGLGLLEISTTLEMEKKLENITGHITAPGFNNAPISGYEIHCGVSTSTTAKYTSFCKQDKSDKLDGFVSTDNQVIGTYVHGLFDSPTTCDRLLAWAGLERSDSRSVSVDQVRDQQLERLADMLEDHLQPDFKSWLLSSETAQKQHE